MAFWWIYTQISIVIWLSPMDFFAMFTGFMIEVKLKFINESFALRVVHMQETFCLAIHQYGLLQF